MSGSFVRFTVFSPSIGVEKERMWTGPVPP
jgi:hypothetical protein